MGLRDCTFSLLLTTLITLAPIGAREAAATTVEPLTLEETVHDAGAIFVGRVAGHQSRWGSDARRWMETDVRVVVEEAIVAQGPVQPGRTVVLTYWGGTIGRETQALADLERPADSQRYLFMLRSDWQQPGMTPTVGFTQGTFRIVAAPGTKAEVREDSGSALRITRDGRIVRAREATAETTGHIGVDLPAFTAWLRANLKRIKATPPRPVVEPDPNDPRLIQPVSLLPERHLVPDAGYRLLLPPAESELPRSSEATGVPLPAPHAPEGAVAVPVYAVPEPLHRAAVRRSQPIDLPGMAGAGGHRPAGVVLHVLYKSQTHAKLPVVVNPLPSSFSFSPLDQNQLAKWNYYADVFRVLHTPTGTYGWKNGRFDLAGWLTSDQVQAEYGKPWSKGTLAITFLDYDDEGTIIEADVVMNAEIKWTSDDEWVYSGGGVGGFRRTMTHEMGHMWGLLHNFDDLSLMNYPDNWFRGFSLPFADDAEAIRSTFPDQAQRRTDLGVYLFYRVGGGSDDQVWRECYHSVIVRAGSSFYVSDYTVENVGTETIEAPTIEWYLTRYRSFARPYYFLGKNVYPSLDRFQGLRTNTVGLHLTVPASVPPGDYYLTAYIPNDDGVSQDSFPFSNNYAFSRTLITIKAP